MQIRMMTEHGMREAPVDRFPQTCPFCHLVVLPTFTNSHVRDRFYVDVVFRCPQQTCARHFFAAYRVGGDHKTYLLDEVVPKTPRPRQFAPSVAKVSPAFVDVAKEAFAVYDLGLHQVAGPGLRKALEMLIKDFAVSKNPDPATREEIREKPLAKCIDAYVDDERLKQVAKRAVWLGNDETHYVKKWVDKDLTDLIGLLTLTLHWVEASLMTEHLLATMPQPAKGSG